MALKQAGSFRLKVSFLSVLVLIQFLMIGLSGMYTRIMVDAMEHWESRKAETVAKFVDEEVAHGTSRVSLATRTIAENQEIMRAFARGDRTGLRKLTEGLWKDLSTHGLEEFEFSRPTPRGMEAFYRAQAPEQYGDLLSAARPMVAKCESEKTLARGLEQDRWGYAFRAVAPVYSGGRYIGCVEFGSGLAKGFLKRISEIHPGRWSIVSAESGEVLGEYGGGVDRSPAAERLPAASDVALAEIRAGHHFRQPDPKAELVSLFVPVRDFKGEVSLYLRHDFDTGFYRNLRKSVWTSIAICLLGLVLSGGVIYVLYREINDPINRLVAETEKIRRFELDEPVAAEARLKEIQKLVTAISRMKTGLVSFQKYVPAQLVRQLIETDQEARISGQRRELTMLFSDIADFTSISETLKPSELTAQLSEYLNAVTVAIMEGQGTVDKYIGDGVMAFWGAPLELKSHAAEACRAALRVQRRLDELNRHWAGEGRPEFRTRIGVNTGEVIVGNMGSEQRLNYTVVGDPVNLASRLEGINKIYQSRIVISQSTYDRCKDEIEVRMLDFATVKGKAEVIPIYELLAERGEISTVDREFARQFTAAVHLYRERRWDEAIAAFMQLSRRRPEDFPTVMFLRRCHGFKAAPPDASWSGAAAA